MPGFHSLKDKDYCNFLVIEKSLTYQLRAVTLNFHRDCHEQRNV